MRLHALLGLAAVFSVVVLGCTFEPGEPWGYIDGELQIESVADSGAVELDDQRIVVEELALRAPAESTDVGGEFDPSDPPPGFFNCHGGHCHHEDGNLYSYDEIEAGLVAPSDSEVVARRALETESTDLGGGVEFQRQFRIVDQTVVNEAVVTVERLVLNGQYHRGGESYALEIELSMSDHPISTGVFYEIGPDSPVRQPLELELSWPDDLFAELEELAEAADDTEEDGGIEIDIHRNQTVHVALIERIERQSHFHWHGEDGE